MSRPVFKRKIYNEILEWKVNRSDKYALLIKGARRVGKSTIAEEFAKKDGCLGLITGESIGQVASQTMHSLAATNEVCTMPVFRPVIGFDKQEIVDVALKINTYETSILPFEDCCTIFVAKHPVTKPNLKVIKRSEEKLQDKIEEMMIQAVETAETIVCE